MKKTTFLAILIGILLTANTFAQTNKGELTTEQKMLPFAIGMSISVLSETHDDNYLAVLSMIEKQIPPYSGDLKPVIDLKKDAADSQRLDVAQISAKAMRARSSKSDKWLMSVGEQFGVIYVQIKKNRDTGDAINADDLKFSLELISILAGKAPQDIPKKINSKFKEVGKLKDADNPTSDKNIKKITDEVINILNTITK
jgi:hypothetical protein